MELKPPEAKPPARVLLGLNGLPLEPRPSEQPPEALVGFFCPTCNKPLRNNLAIVHHRRSKGH